ncbi:MAG: UDP-glucose/GDP-mannose dehydrogenase family protein [Gemmatimonadetes bacterium]|nr:UDP-glucose/GDP-mannose dehydrogenase family protein [Gemmatimonadota bacterium]
MAAVIASRGHLVMGFDVNDRAVEAINQGRTPVAETGLAELIRANSERLQATSNLAEAVLRSDVTFVVVPTPSDANGGFSLQHAAVAFEGIGRALAGKSEYHLIVLTSTVLPGATRFGLLPILEAAAGKRCGDDFGLCYGPELIALGSVIQDLLNPDFKLVGQFDQRSGDGLEALYGSILVNGAPCSRMTIENAELTKIALNSYVTTKISFANMLAELCERIPGGDIDVVSGALGRDARIGRRYLTGALGYGGPCFPRDNHALSFLARELGVNAHLAEATEAVNDAIVGQIVERLGLEIDSGTRVAILGLAYKPGTPVVEASQAVSLARALAAAGAEVVAFDPLGGDEARRELGSEVLVVDTLHECVSDAEIIMITSPDPAFQGLGAEDLAADKTTVIVVDFWRILDPEAMTDRRIEYRAVGKSVNDGANSDRLLALWGLSFAESS